MASNKNRTCDKLCPPNLGKQPNPPVVPQLLATHSSCMKKENILNTFRISVTCLIIIQPQENSWSAQKPLICPKSGKKLLRGEERTRTYLGCPYAAGPNSSGLPGACATRHSPERPQGCSDLHEDCLSLQQPSQTENTQVKFKPPAQPSSLATPAPCLPCCAQGCNFFSCHLTALKTRADQQPDAKKEQVKKLIYLLRQVA